MPTKLQLLNRLGACEGVLLASHLRAAGISTSLQQHYLRSGWLVRVGRGAHRLASARTDWRSAVRALQEQAGLPIHVGGGTALALRGRAHQLALGEGAGPQPVELFGPPRWHLPAWVAAVDPTREPEAVRTGMLPMGLGVERLSVEGVELRVASAERAVLEVLFRTPAAVLPEAARHLVEGLVDLRPTRVTALLEACTLRRVVRLFVLLAERAGHPWWRRVDLGGVERGGGKLRIGGVEPHVYVAEHRLSVPASLLGEEEP